MNFPRRKKNIFKIMHIILVLSKILSFVANREKVRSSDPNPYLSNRINIIMASNTDMVRLKVFLIHFQGELLEKEERKIASNSFLVAA